MHDNRDNKYVNDTNMTAAAEIQIVNPSNLARIESFLNDPSYKEIIENSSTFNSRLCAERRMRMPFVNAHTGVAQNPCNLFMTKQQRMPGQKEGQVYTYPAQRWRKSHRQYLTMSTSGGGWSEAEKVTEQAADGENSSSTQSEAPGGGGGGDDSRDGSQTASKDDPKMTQEWFYDELAMEEMETGEEPDPESDEDYYDDTYANRRKRRGAGTPTGPGSRGMRVRKSLPDEASVKRGRASRGRKRAGQGALSYEVPGDKDKPFGCELCSAKYKTRPGLMYHFTHTHKEAAGGSASIAGSDGDSRDSKAGAHSPLTLLATDYQDSYVTFLNNPAGAPIYAGGPPSAVVRGASPPPRPASADTSSSDSHAPLVPPAAAIAAPADKKKRGRPMLRGHSKASRSPYCDFCLGDDRENKKNGTPEQLVSCSDCGRSGHPTCLQFTDNMKVSVRQYRWQCIECKCCSICGTSDNDDQLLFCDDCDRGYHMYCLAAPLEAPPEGSWSCFLCIQIFHK